MKLDIHLTQGSYWKGAQIPYWLYKLLVILPFTGLLGIDHLLLRSPITAILKFLSIIPLFGFWYFYDMAQLGEEDLIKKHGIGVPFYGPIGIGAGIFQVPGEPMSPDTIPRPWLYVGYVLTTMLFIAFPVNKLVLGDYWGAITQFLMYFGPFVLIGIGWGFYDMYRVLFDATGLLEKGPARVPPASWFLIDPYYNKSVLGPLPAESFPPNWFSRLFTAAAEVPITGLKATASVMETAGDVTKGVMNTAEAVTTGVIGKVAEQATSSITETMETASNAGEKIIESTAGVAGNSLTAAADVSSLLAKIPAIANNITKKLGDPNELLKAAKVSEQAGGSMLVSSSPSSLSIVIVFSVALLAFGGYTMYALRTITKPYSENDNNNDTPPEPARVRRTFKV